MTDALDTPALELADQTDWVDVEDGPRVRLAFIPQAVWSSLLGRQDAISKGRDRLRDRLDSGESDDPAADARRLGAYQEQLLQVAGEVVGRSLREVEGRDPLRMVGDVLAAEELESLALDGEFWPVHAAVMRAHWVDADQARALFRSGLG